MASYAFTMAWNVLIRRRSTLWLYLWSIVVGMVMLGLWFAFGLAALTPSLVHPAPYAPLTSNPLFGAPPSLLTAFIVYFLILAFGIFPFISGATYGSLAEALKDVPVAPRSYWINGLKYFGASYKAFFVILAEFILVALTGVILAVILHFLGPVGMILTAIAGFALFIFGIIWSMWSLSAVYVGRSSFKTALAFGFKNSTKRLGPSLLMALAILGIAILFDLFYAALALFLPGSLVLLVEILMGALYQLFVSAAALSLYLFAQTRA